MPRVAWAIKSYMNDYFSKILNGCRWSAAFFVVIAHARHLTFAPYSEVLDRTLFIKGFYFLTGLGHEAVLIFFVISGLLVGGLTIRRSTFGFDLRNYSLHRISRIYSVLILALIVGWLLDGVGLKYFNDSSLYTDSARYGTTSMEFVIGGRLDAVTFLGNALSLQSVFVSPLGSNAPLWSLAYEWWYYVIFGAAMVAYHSRVQWARIIGAVVILTALCVLPAELLLWGIVWLLGVGVYYYGTSPLPKPPRWIAVVLFLAVLVYTRLSHTSEGPVVSEPLLLRLARDLFLGGAFAVLLLSFWNRSGSLVGSRVHEWLASFSFSTYLIHFPIYVFVSAVAHDVLGQQLTRQPSVAAFMFMFFAVVVACGSAWLFSLVTEQRTAAVKEFLSKRWSVAEA